MNQTGTRHYLECATNLQTRRLQLRLITSLIIADRNSAGILINRPPYQQQSLLYGRLALTTQRYCWRGCVSENFKNLIAAHERLLSQTEDTPENMCFFIIRLQWK